MAGSDKFYYAAVLMSVLTVLNMSLFISWKMKKYYEPCNAKNILSAVVHYVKENSKTSIHLHDVMKKYCNGQQIKRETTTNLVNSIRQMLHACRHSSVLVSHDQTIPILTLFTEYSMSTNNERFIYTTISSWNKFSPQIQLVLFSNETAVRKFAEDRGWTVYFQFQNNKDAAMLQTVRNGFNSTFYGFASFDLLFSEKLIESLIVATSSAKQNRDFLLTGKAYVMDEISANDIISNTNLRLAVSNRGSVPTDSKEEFFFVSKSFAWQTNMSFNQNLLQRATCANVHILDTTETVMAVKQSVTNMIGQVAKRRHFSFTGEKSNCRDAISYFNLCGDVAVRWNPKLCKCNKQ